MNSSAGSAIRGIRTIRLASTGSCCHVTLAMLALAVLTILTATAQQSHADTEIIALPVAEIRRRQSFDDTHEAGRLRGNELHSRPSPLTMKSARG